MKIILESNSAQGWMQSHRGDPRNRCWDTRTLRCTVQHWDGRSCCLAMRAASQLLLPARLAGEHIPPLPGPMVGLWARYAHSMVLSNVQGLRSAGQHMANHHTGLLAVPRSPRRGSLLGKQPIPRGLSEGSRVPGCVHLQSIRPEDRDCPI